MFLTEGTLVWTSPKRKAWLHYKAYGRGWCLPVQICW